MNKQFLVITIKREWFYQSKYTQFKLKSKGNILMAHTEELVRDLQVIEIIRWQSDLVHSSLK